MKERILTNWTITRVLYLVLGLFVIIQAVTDGQWLGAAFGSYFAAMGLFAFGCASGNCFAGNYSATSNPKSKTSIEDVEFEEVN
jgi:hypothetical protein